MLEIPRKEPHHFLLCDCPHCGKPIQSEIPQSSSQWTFLCCDHCQEYSLAKAPTAPAARPRVIPSRRFPRKPSQTARVLPSAPDFLRKKPPAVVTHVETLDKLPEALSIPERRAGWKDWLGDLKWKWSIPFSFALVATLTAVTVNRSLSVDSRNPPLLREEPGKLQVTPLPRSKKIQSRILQRSSAPLRHHSDLMKINVSRTGTVLRAGPGEQFPVVKTAKAGEEFQVSDFNNNWFRVLDSTGAKASIWVKNDRVTIVYSEHKTIDQSTLPKSPGE